MIKLTKIGFIVKHVLHYASEPRRSAGLQNQWRGFDYFRACKWSRSSVGSEQNPYKIEADGSNPSATTMVNLQLIDCKNTICPRGVTE